ncbi:MAG: hypothetical protein HUU46_22290 [Candidatus Hydrogenedentes bacterium]|nr:hypothetical protein [Candidatus Hydrogenedentota bacterium]
MRFCSSSVRLATAVAFALASISAPAADAPAPEAIDAAIDKVIALDPAAVAAKLAEYKAQIEALQKESAEKKAQADELEKKATAELARLDSIKERIATLKVSLGLPADDAAGDAAAGPEMAMAAAPSSAPTATPAADTMADVKPSVTFNDHIQPLLKAKCVKCHNQDTQRGGFALHDYGALMQGGGSGAVIAPGNADGSRLFRLVSGAEEPKMPPSGDGFNPEELAKIKEWISLGAPVDANAKIAKAEEKPKEAMQAYVAAAIVDGPPPMPEVALPAPAPENAKQVVARAVATNPRSPLVAIGGYKQVILYDLEKRAILGALPFPEGEIFSLTFSVSGELLVAGGGESGDSGCAVVWNVRKGDRAGKFGEEYDAVMACDISPDHARIAIGMPTKKVKVFNVADGAEIYKIEDHTDWIYAVKFSPDGELLATADRAGGLLLWQAANGRPVEALRGHSGAIHDLCYSNDSALLASASADGSVRLWDTWKYQQTAKFDPHPGGVLSVDFANNNELVTTGIDGQTKRWDTGGKNLATYAALPDWGYSARFGANDAIVLAGAWNGVIELWETASGTKVGQVLTSAAQS